MMLHLRAVALLCLAVVMPTQVFAQAAVHSTLAIVVVPQSKKQADEAEGIERLLSEAAQRLDTVRLFELSPMAGVESNAKAAEQIEEALRALLLRTPKRAQERLQTAVQALAEAPAAGDVRLYARLWKAQALVQLANNELVKGRDALLKSLILFPNQAPPEYAAYGTAARELFEATLPVLKALPTGDIKVAVKGQRGDIWVDGAFRGTSNAAGNDLPQGAHRVAVRASGFQGERRFVDVAAGKVASVDFDLKQAPFGPELEQGRAVLMANFGQPSVVEDRMRELRNQLGADQMMVIRPKLQKKSTELSGYFLSADGTFRKIDATITKDEAYMDNLGKLVADTVGSRLLPDPAAQPLDQRQNVVVDENKKVQDIKFEEPEDVNKKPSITRKWWFWTAVAVGAGLVGGGLYLISRTSETVRPGATGDMHIKLNYLH